MSSRAQQLACRLMQGVTLLFLAGPALALTPDPSSDAPAGGWYVVKPGDNLHVIAARVLGDRRQWPRLWRLNPEIKDPDVLRPGARIRVPGAGEAAWEAGAKALAELSRLSQRVEEQPHPLPYWATARLGDQLRERDGLRTLERASAELTFADGLRYLVSERSLLFLRAPAAPGPRRTRALEVLGGQADVELKPSAPGAREVEIVVGASLSRARPASDDGALARARRTGSGAAQLMVFRGAGDMRARGVHVDVPRGMGTSAQPGQAPAAPEKLLAAPLLVGPTGATRLDHANPILSWDPVPGAVSYTVEICRDPDCGELIDRVAGVSATRWASDGLPPGSYHWRVSAVSRSGLDGYASVPGAFAVLSRWRRPHAGAP